jgi:predicted DNA-binding transcriptional regulator YafY
MLHQHDFAISDSQLSKDIKYMQESKDAPIVFDKQKGGYVYTEKDYSFEHHAITEEDKWLLDFANAAMNAYGNSSLIIQFDGLVQKLSTGNKQHSAADIDAKSFIAVEQSYARQGFDYLHVFYTAIIERKVFSMQYHPFGKGVKTYELSPYLLKQYRNSWYVIGYTDVHERVHVFALDRIKSLKLTTKKYFIDTRFDANAYFQYSFGVTHQHDYLPQKVRLWFNQQHSNYILSQPLHHSQQVIETTESGTTVELNVWITWELKAMICSYSNGVKVLEPKTLQDDIAAQLKNAAELYNNG